MGQITCRKGDSYMQEDTNRPTGERWVSMNNALTRAGHGLSLAEKRIVMIAVSKLDSMKIMQPGEMLPSVRITALEYAETYGVDPNTAYEALQGAAKNLFDRKLTFFEAADRRDGKPLKPTRNDMRWVGRCQYHEGEGWVQLAWWPDLLPSLVGLRKQFTTYQLQQASALRSMYSWRLLELLMRFKSTGKAEYTIKDFATSMDATEKQRADFGKIRTKIIEPAVKELVEKQGWEIQWRAIKAGRKVQSLRFDFLPAGLSGKLLDGGTQEKLRIEHAAPASTPAPSSAPGEDINCDSSNTCPACGSAQRLEGFAVCKTCAEDLSCWLSGRGAAKAGRARPPADRRGLPASL